MSKTAREWFDTLPQDLYDRVTYYYDGTTISGKDRMADDSIEESLFDAISGAFNWTKSDEGFDFWLKVANHRPKMRWPRIG